MRCKLALSFSGELISVLSVLMVMIFNSCSSHNMLINTQKDLSGGLRSGDNIYFLCNYVISAPGKTIIPMYIYSPGKVYLNSLNLYSFNIINEKLTRIAELNSLASDPGKADIQFSKWASDGSAIYFLYNSGWDKTVKRLAWNFFRYNSKVNTVEEIKGDEKEGLIKQYFPGENLVPLSKENLIDSSKVWYYVGVLPDDSWQLSSPVSYSEMSESEYVKVIVERFNDRFFREAAFKKLRLSLTSEKLKAIIISMEKKFNKLSSYEKMQYRPYMEEWSSRIYIETKFVVKPGEPENTGVEEAVFRNDIKKTVSFIESDMDINKPDAYGLTLLMIACYADNSDIADKLIKRGADINAQDKNGCTALMYAIFGKAYRTMTLLLKMGADKQKVTVSKWNAWMFVSDTRLRQRYIEYLNK